MNIFVFVVVVHVLDTSGNSAGQAIELLIQKGVPESHIIFLNLISVSEISRLHVM